MPVRINIKKHISEVFYAKGGYIRKLSFDELKVYDLLCFLATERSQCHVSLGDLENYTELPWWRGIRRALMSLQKKGLIRLVSMTLSDDRDYQKDILKIEMEKSR